MSRTYKTARGKVIDMDKIKLANENVVAIGNMKINARGDKIGVGGKIEAGRNKIMDQIYAVQSESYSPTSPDQVAQRKAILESNKAKELHDLATGLIKSNLDIEAPTESNTTNEGGPTSGTRSTRGSLASSVAKTTTVKQQPIPDPRKSDGPSRI